MFLKKRNEDIVIKLEEKLQRLEQGIDAENKQLEGVNQNISRLQSAVQKHDMAIENLLDEWEERQSDEDSVKERFREYGQCEQHLLELFEAYQEQFWNLKRFADAKDETWSAQIALMEKNLEHYRQLCGISLIGECGVLVDYELHEVIKVVDTADSGQDGQVADVYRCGYIYKGKVKKKAQVTAYQTEKGK